MKVGIPTEIKTQEFRAGITPAGVHALKQAGHEVLVQKGAGLGSMITDEEYRAAGARIVDSAAEIWASDMVVKVKEPLPAEYEFFHKDLLLFTYLHLAPEPELTKKLLEKQVTGIAYETVQLDNGALPLLAPMSEVAGRMATQVGAQMLTKREGGMGLLMGGTAGVEAAEVVILGAGTVGLSAAKVAMGMGARVTMLDSNINRLRQLDDIYGQKLQTLFSNAYNIALAVKKADLLIGSVLIPGALTPKLVTEDMVKTMKKGSAIVDVALDQGGCIATTARHGCHISRQAHVHGTWRSTLLRGQHAGCGGSHVHLCPDQCNHAVYDPPCRPGLENRLPGRPGSGRGINTCKGHVFFKYVGEALGYDVHDLAEIL